MRAACWTHFLALQVSHSKLVQAAFDQVHAALVSHDSGLRLALEPAVKAHVTVMMLDLGRDGERVPAAVSCLDSLRASLEEQQLLQPLKLRLGGLGNFDDQVLFLTPSSSDPGGTRALHELAAVTRRAFAAQGLDHPDQRPFAPHVTIAKMSNLRMKTKQATPWGRRKQRRLQQRQQRRLGEELEEQEGGRQEMHEDQQQGSQPVQQGRQQEEQQQGEPEELQGQGDPASGSASSAPPPPSSRHPSCLPPDAYCGLQDIDCGEVEVGRIQLCQMAKRQQGCFYTCVASLDLGMDG